MSIISTKAPIVLEVNETFPLGSASPSHGGSVAVEALGFSIGYPSNAVVQWSADAVNWNSAGQLMPGNSAVAFVPESISPVLIRVANSGTDPFTIPASALFRVTVA